VSDGDSLWVQPAEAGAKAVEIRLADIDAPEICQAWGPQARDALKDQVTGKTVTVRVVGHDGYGRTLAKLGLDGQDISAWLVQEGHAWSNRTRWDRGHWSSRRGWPRPCVVACHANPDKVIPKEFRRSQGPCPGRPTRRRHRPHAEGRQRARRQWPAARAAAQEILQQRHVVEKQCAAGRVEFGCHCTAAIYELPGRRMASIVPSSGNAPRC